MLDKLAMGLGVTLASLFGASRADASSVVRHADQCRWTDPQSGYTRRNISPPGMRSTLHIVQIDFPAGASFLLQTGDCLAMRENSHIVFQNTGSLPARYAVVVGAGLPTP